MNLRCWIALLMVWKRSIIKEWHSKSWAKLNYHIQLKCLGLSFEIVPLMFIPHGLFHEKWEKKSTCAEFLSQQRDENTISIDRFFIQKLLKIWKWLFIFGILWLRNQYLRARTIRNENLIFTNIGRVNQLEARNNKAMSWNSSSILKRFTLDWKNVDFMKEDK